MDKLQFLVIMKVSYGLCHMDTQLHHDNDYVQFWKQRSQQQNVLLFHINAHFIYFNTCFRMHVHMHVHMHW